MKKLLVLDANVLFGLTITTFLPGLDIGTGILLEIDRTNARRSGLLLFTIHKICLIGARICVMVL